MSDESKVSRDRELLLAAQERGSVLAAYAKLSGPGWLQSAITLGGGSLTGALFLGVLGGTSMLWLQLVAIFMGVVMLSAISYVTLSTGERPFRAINQHINPVLGWGWLIATSAANMIWCMPQFSLSYDALDKNLVPGGLAPADASASVSLGSKLTVSLVLLVLASILLVLNERRGLTSRLFDLFLKSLVGLIVICFFGVVARLMFTGGMSWSEVIAGFVPDLSQWNQPTGRVAEILESVPEPHRQFWFDRIVKNQRNVMIGAAATAVGINMTFLLPYSMLARGWDKPFRGLARFDLGLGMAVPYVLVTSCVVIASAYSFHGRVDEAFLSDDPAVMSTSNIFGGASKELNERMAADVGRDAWTALSDSQRARQLASLPEAEKRLATTLVKRDAFQLSQSLAPLLGERMSNLIFGLGVLAMGFSTIVILMLINAYVYREIAPPGLEQTFHYLGAAVAGITGALWPLIWTGDSKFWLAILTSTFGMMLLPIAYVTFFFMMNSRDLLGEEKPTGTSMVIWNVYMLFSVVGALVAAGSAIWTKMGDPKAGTTIVSVFSVFAVLVVIGFLARMRRAPAEAS